MCEICYNFDEFYACHNCFHSYLEKTINFRKYINSDKYELKSAIQDILSKNAKKIVLYNKNSLRNAQLQQSKIELKQIESEYTKKAHLKNLLLELVNKKRENVKHIKETYETYIQYIDKGKSNNTNVNTNTNIITYMNLTKKVKRYFINCLLLNTFNDQYIKISDFFEIQEFLKPDFAKSNKNDLKDFDNIPNVLSISESGLFNNVYLNNDMNEEKSIKINPKILQNKFLLYNLNIYIYKIYFFVQRLLEYFHITSPYPLSDEIFSVKNPNDEQLYSLYIEYYNQEKINEIIQGYIYLDINLQFLRKYIHKYINNEVYTKNILCYTPDLRDFLNVKSISENYFTSNSENKELLKIDAKLLSTNKIFKIDNTSIEVEIPDNVKEQTKKYKEEDGFLIIDNYYI